MFKIIYFLRGKSMSTNMEFKMLQVQQIIKNPDNPRGKYESEDDNSFPGLVESVALYGVIVPLIVKKLDGNTYMLIDGDRRYTAAQKARLSEVPAYVIEGEMPGQMQNYLVTMYQIHMNRKDWDPATQQKYSEIIQEDIKRQIAEESVNNSFANEPAVNETPQPSAQESSSSSGQSVVGSTERDESSLKDMYQRKEKERYVVAKKLSERTGMRLSRATENVLFSEWPEEIKKDIVDVSANRKYYSHIISIEKSFIQPLIQSFPVFVENEGLANIRRNLYKKITSKVLGGAMGYRNLEFLFSYSKDSLDDKAKVETLIYKFIYEPYLNIKQLNSLYFNIFLEDLETAGKSFEEYELSINLLIKQLLDYNIENFSTEDNEKIKNKLHELMSTINKILEI